MTINEINQGNKAVEFISERIKDDNYRGAPSSEHNRYTVDQIINILILLDKYAPNKSLMSVRTTDISRRPKNNPEEFLYAEFCNEAKRTAGIGTQDAMRKNLFVDLQRMELIDRYNENKEKTAPFSQQRIKYVSISDQGLKLVKAKNILDKYFIFSKGIDKLLGGYIDIVLNILRDHEYGINQISVYEYMFFVSAIGVNFSFNINTDKAVELIKEYRNLTPIQRKSIIVTLRKELKPKNFTGSKIQKRDFGNWKNKIDQIFYLLNQTVYFEKRGEQLVLKGGENSFVETETRLDRSLNEKYQYFVKQEIEKTIGFELHHIVPLSWSESVYHFKILDKWENMVYIDGFSHAKITQNRNRNVVLETVKKELILKDYSNNKIYLKFKESVLYKIENQPTMKKYNEELLNTIN